MTRVDQRPSGEVRARSRRIEPVKSGSKNPRRQRAEKRLSDLLVSDAPNVVTLVRIEGEWRGLRRDGDRIKVLRLGRR